MVGEYPYQDYEDSPLWREVDAVISKSTG